MRAAIIGAGLILTAAAWVAYRQKTGEETATLETMTADAAAPLLDALSTVSEFVGVSMWSENKIPAQYLNAIRQAEAANNLPRNLLARLLWQESRYRPDIISGAVVSPAGALGIAQFMPATAAQYRINPLDPFQAIPAAGKMMGELYKRFGSWDAALAAYNWGQGNVAKKGLAAAPKETKNYFAQILSDIGLA